MKTMTRIEEKLDALCAALSGYGKLAVAFSAGVDSSFLLAVAHEELGDAACALTATGPAFPVREQNEAVAFCKEHGIRHLLFDADQFAIEGFENNPPERCYICKHALFTRMLEMVNKQDLGVLADGSNVDDLGEHRPGKQALRELGIVSPLVDCGFTKADIRAASEVLGLPTATKQSSPCLATRFPYNTLLTPEALALVGTAEEYLLELGFSPLRVRVHGSTARVEIEPAQFELFEERREEITSVLKTLGYDQVELDERGFRSGSMDELTRT